MVGEEGRVDSTWLLAFGAWLIACGASGGSLFFSEIMEFPPCTLCWYQRIFMFPLVLVLGVGLFPVDRNVVRFGLPLAAVGGLVAGYHALVHAGVVPEAATPCSEGVSCATKYVDFFGFLSIPVLSLIAFSGIVLLLAMTAWRLE